MYHGGRAAGSLGGSNEHAVHHHRCHHGLGAEEDRQPGRADHRARADRVHTRRVRSRRVARARARAQRRWHDDLESREVRPIPRGHPQALPRHHRAVFDGRAQRRRRRTWWHAASEARHGVAVDGLGELQDDDLREPSEARRRPRAAHARQRREAGDRDLRSRHALQRREPGPAGAAQVARARAVRARHSEFAAGGSRGARVRDRAAEACAAGRHLDGGRRGALPAGRQRMDARARRSLPDGSRGQRALRQEPPCRGQCGTRGARCPALRSLWPYRSHSRRSAPPARAACSRKARATTAPG